MPRKIRELIRDLAKAGFVSRGGKGSHRTFKHVNGAIVTISGNTGDDAQPNQERGVAAALKEAGQ